MSADWEGRFDELVELAGEERALRLAEIAAAEPELGRRLAELLAADARSTERLLRPVAEGAPAFVEAALGAAPGARDRAGERVGRYRLVSPLGRGGMGEVWLAERADGEFESRVALKLIRSGGGSEAILARFLRERQILARLDHPGIARLLDGGRGDDGEPYFVLEYVDGTPITDWSTERSASLDERLRLFVQVARAVDHAHRSLVVHRDLKPSNILVDGQGRAKLLDFGIAKVLGGDEGVADEGREGETRVGGMALTPAYASPEQILGEPVTTATDVYALGVLLYELLTGSKPHPRTARQLPALARELALEAAERPSARLRRSPPAGLAPPEARRAAAKLEGDLDTIILQALQPEPARRYPGAAALADDLERFLDGRPVRARPPSAGYLARRFVGRHRLAVGAAIAVVLALSTGLAVAMSQAELARREAESARVAARRAEEAQGFLESLFDLTDPERTRGARLTAGEILERGAARLDLELADEPALRAELRAVVARAYMKLGLYPPALELSQRAVGELRGLEGGEHGLARALSVQGLSLHRLGRYEEARPVLEESHRLSVALGDAEASARALGHLANLERALGRFEKALALSDGELAGLRAAGADRTQGYARALNNRGIILWRLGRRPDAIATYEEALALHEATSGPGSPLVASTLGNLVYLYSESDDPARARVAAERSLEVLKAAYANETPMLAEAHQALGTVLSDAGDFEAAARAYRTAAGIYRRTLGERHPNVAWPTRNLGRLLTKQGRYAEALPYYREALAIREAAYPDALHPEVAESCVDVGKGYYDLGKWGRGEAYTLRAVEILRAVRPESERLASAIYFHAVGLIETGRRDEGWAALEECMAMRRRVLPPDHPMIADGEAAMERVRRTGSILIP